MPMSGFDRQVTAWLQSHQGTVSIPALEAAGVSRTQRRRLVRLGLLQRVLNGGYRFSGAEPDELTRCAALCASRPTLVIAGPTAGRIWEIRRSPRDDLVHVIAPPRSQPCREPWVRAYRTDLLHADEIVYRPDGIRLTSPPRTLVDLARYLSDDALASAIEYTLAKGVCTVATLYRVAHRLNTPGRPWVRRFLRVLEGRTPGSPRESDWERLVYDALFSRGLTDVECQVRQTLPGFGAARFDMAIESIRWMLEVDVHPEHRTVEGQARDCRRTRSSRRVGWDVDRVAELELTAAFDETLDDVVAGAEQRRREVAALTSAGLWWPNAAR